MVHYHHQYHRPPKCRFRLNNRINYPILFNHLLTINSFFIQFLINHINRNWLFSLICWNITTAYSFITCLTDSWLCSMVRLRQSMKTIHDWEFISRRIWCCSENSTRHDRSKEVANSTYVHNIIKKHFLLPLSLSISPYIFISFRIEDRINLDHMQMLKKHFDAAAVEEVEGRLSMDMFIMVMSQLLNLPDEVF